MSDVPQILRAIAEGEPAAPDQLLPLVYDELYHLAAHRLTHQAPGQTLQPTALVHEDFEVRALTVVGGDGAIMSDAGGRADGRRDTSDQGGNRPAAALGTDRVRGPVCPTGLAAVFPSLEIGTQGPR
jgi:hypothetical protein